MKYIKGYEGLYSATKDGKIYSHPKYRHKGKFLKQHIKKDGYVEVGLSKDRKRKTFIVHRIIAETFIDNLLNKSEVNHKDGIKTNNNISNLEWVTSSENQIHSIKNGLQKFTEKHRLSAIETGRKNGRLGKGKKKLKQRKTSEIQDEEIKDKFNSGVSCIKLAKEYGVSKKTILNIKNNRKYKKD